MIGIFRQLRGHGALLTALAAVVIGVATLPLFGSTAYAAGVNLNNSVQISRFVIPQVPITKITSPIAAGSPGAIAGGLIINVSDDIDVLFPESGEIVVSKTELMTYDNGTPLPANCTTRTSKQFCATARAKQGSASAHTPQPAKPDPFSDSGRIKLATQVTTQVEIADGATTTLLTTIAQGAGTPIAISVGDNSGFSASGFLTISHAETIAFGPGTEFFAYDKVTCGTAAQLCLTQRALNPTNEAFAHPVDGTTIACTVTNVQNCVTPEKMRSTVNEHFQVDVKSNAGFFPQSTLYMYTLTGTVVSAEETFGQVNPNTTAATKVKPACTIDVNCPTTQLHITARNGTCGIGLFPADDCGAQVHPVGTIVTGPDGYLVCRSRNEVPAAFPSAPANSVGVFSVCQTGSQIFGTPKNITTKKLLIPFSGSELITLNGLGQSFLSTGGFCHQLYGEAGIGGDCEADPQVIPAPVDADGTKGDVNDCDGDSNTTELLLCLTSPCITGFSPGTNLKIFIQLDTDKTLFGQDIGSITVVLDTVHDDIPNNGDECDDPAGTGDIIIDTYDAGPPNPNAGSDPSALDDDTDGDGCDDKNELDNNLSLGGKRDPWNPNDFYDTDASGDVSIDDISAVAAAFLLGTGDAGYGANLDSGGTHGPNGWNVGAPDGNISIDDISAVALQFLNAC